ncbi:fimbria/pilus outer membrane usher protein [Cronobacter sakazakii]|nr:fimbrial biogenesis outer membrane usher protein [Cronobacter sakazakii]MDK1224768.1 fimbria/pilus outer membrane usher protein [Cronobacter turicensis]KAB0819978.1 fimbrial biogenesis outer membrane usher protein [Cronobacter sakazakii]MDI7511792.1 fimbria/pilus outer membrane usher protein [Cronobacter sakazakii]MDI7523380.1 fimbria/pilus outer membrane usher protein [Cronobacter sakazakii]
MKNRFRQGEAATFSPGIMAVIICLLATPGKAQELPGKSEQEPVDIAEHVEFDNIFLNLENKNSVDLSRFANGAAALPGRYRALVYINGQATLTSEIDVVAQPDKTSRVCLTSDLIKTIPFNYEKLPKDFLTPFQQGEQCLDLEKKLPHSEIAFDTSEQRLDISVPQIYLLHNARGSVNPELWDSGIPALMLGYNMNGYSSHANGKTLDSFYSSLEGGLNVGAWYLRHNGYYSYMEEGERQYSSISTYLQRDIPVIKGRALIGETSTQGQVFDTLPFKGVQVASDERMLPESQRGYAPDIRGVARTNARVTVRQSGQTIYETTVAPGEFAINDLYPTGYGGNLDVTVYEADGSEQHFQVPYASVAQQLRPGALRYSVVAGEYRNDSLRTKPALYQATYQYGISNRLTSYGGVQVSQGYYALLFGMAFGTPIGSLALDVTQARTHLDNGTSFLGQRRADSLSGQSYKISFSKDITETRSNISLAAYRFATSQYMDFQTAMLTRDAVDRGESPDNILRMKNQFVATVSQGLDDGWGQFYLSGSLQDYWNKAGSDKQFQVGYNNNYKSLTYGVTVSRTYSKENEGQTNYLLTMSFPLGEGFEQHTPHAHIDLTRDSNGHDGQQVGVSGSLGDYNQMNYSVTAMNGDQGQGTSGSFNADYRSQVTSVSGGYTSDTFALVEAKGARGAAVSTYPGVFVDGRGYAAVPYLDPYQFNDITVDPKTAPVNVELENTSQKVAPYLGAVVKLTYKTNTGTPVLIASNYQGEPVPFGAVVFDAEGNQVGSAGQGGLVYARVGNNQGQLTVKWGESVGMQCLISYLLMPQAEGQRQSIQRFETPCLPPSGVASSSSPLQLSIDRRRQAALTAG